MAEDALAPVQLLAPHFSITREEKQLYHMISDRELTLLSKAETGVLGSFGFTMLGAALGLLQPLSVLSEKIGNPAQHIERPDVVTISAFAGCVVGAFICLLLFATNKVKQYGLANQIRVRPQIPTPSIADPKVVGTPIGAS